MPTAAEKLCLSCGLCCNGGLFTSVPLKTSDERAVGTGLLRIFQRADGSRLFRQPCGAHSASGCQVYEDRPDACRGFECLLLIAVREDEVSKLEAGEIVQRTSKAVGPDRDTLVRRYFISQRAP